MNTIDLTKAKIGDKFLTKMGFIMEFYNMSNRGVRYKYFMRNTNHNLSTCSYNASGEPNTHREEYRLVEKVKVEQKKEEKKEPLKEETKRRQDVLKYADMLFFDQKDTRVALFRYDEAIKAAENIVNIKDEYRKEGKLC